MLISELNLALDLANYILDCENERRDFIEHPIKQHIYYKAMRLIYDEEQIKNELKQLNIVLEEKWN